MTQRQHEFTDDAKWEILDVGRRSLTRRLKVPGGWLVAYGFALTFYEDPKHEWNAPTREPSWFERAIGDWSRLLQLKRDKTDRKGSE